MESNIWLVGGTFDSDGGKPSYIVSEMSKELSAYTINGGHIEILHKVIKDLNQCMTLVWMPNISNKEEKILPTIKTVNPKLLLVSSKRVIEKDYKESDVVGRLLATKSNLGIMISKEAFRNFNMISKEAFRNFKLLDPLGNIWADTGNISELCTKLINRVIFLSGLTRIPSEKISCDPIGYKIDSEFIEIIHKFGNEFTKYVMAVNPNRFLGNAATRCSYGFPSFRVEDRIFVTRRNVDKTSLSEKDFVEVKLLDNAVGYYGENKPSVDTPIQLKLFDYYPNIKYMLHGHVYAQESPFTGWLNPHRPATSKLPCGSIEEFTEITKLFTSNGSFNFTVNLFGHGFLALANDLKYFSKLKLRERPFPEGV